MTGAKRFGFILLLHSVVFLLIIVKNGSFLFSNLNNARFIIPWITYQQVLFFLFAQCLLLLMVSAITLAFATPLIRRFPNIELEILAFSFSFLTFIIFSTNQLLYPQSQYAVLWHSLLPSQLTKLLLIISVTLFFIVIFSALNLRQLFTLLLIVLGGFLLQPFNHPLIQNKQLQPNIILIGIDSLRLGELQHAPSIKYFLESGQYFTNAITPLARTYPAWMSILSGQYPKHHGSIFNLCAPFPKSGKQSLAVKLKALGYQTVFATDENRFSNIDKRMGFQILVGPKIGAADFLIGKLNDIPLFNILSQSIIAKKLFPYSYINRASYIHYQPQTFNRTLLNTLDKLNPNKPLFLATHLTLTHWPLLYAKSPAIDNELSGSQKTLFSLYPKALNNVDKQFNQLIKDLKKRQLLKNAIVVLLSDHGDASFYEKNRLTSPANYILPHHFKFRDLLDLQEQQLEKSFGHGTDVLTPTQYQVALSFHFYPEKKSHAYKLPVSLVDIKPTLLSYLNIRDNHNDGVSLKAAIEKGKMTKLKHRAIFTETGLNPDIKIYDKKSMASIASYGQKIYRINPHNGYLMLKKSIAKKLIKTKQYAIITKDYIFASYPSFSKENALDDYVNVILNFHTLKWSDDMDSTLAKDANSQLLQQKLKKFREPVL